MIFHRIFRAIKLTAFHLFFILLKEGWCETRALFTRFSYSPAMSKNEIIAAIEQLCDEKNLSFDAVIDSIEAALAVAYRKEFGNKNLNCHVEFNPEDGSMRIFDIKTVTTDELAATAAAEAAEREQLKQAGEYDRGRPEKPASTENEVAEDDEPRFHPRLNISLADAKLIKPDAEVDDEIITELPLPEGYGRVAAQTAKQVIMQKLREAERETLFDLYKDRMGQVVNATVQRVEGPLVYMDLGQATAIMPPGQQIRGEQYRLGSRFKVLLMSVEKTRRGPEVVASRTAPDMVRSLFTMEVPEIASGAIEIKAVAREAGGRSKIAVVASQENIDPIGSCVGQRGARVQTVMSELGGEKIDIIEYNEDLVKFIVNALSPAKVSSVEILHPDDEQERTAQVVVPEDQLSLAIGKGGQNVRLASKLTGCKIDIMKHDEPQAAETAEADEHQASETESDETTPSSETVDQSDGDSSTN